MHYTPFLNRGRKRTDFGDFWKPNGGSEQRAPLHVTYLLFGDRGGAETDKDDDNRGEDTEDEGEVEVVQVLQHSWSSVLLTTRWCAINKLHDHPNETNSQPNHEAPESPLRKESRKKGSLHVTFGSSFPFSSFFFFNFQLFLRLRPFTPDRNSH